MFALVLLSAWDAVTQRAMWLVPDLPQILAVVSRLHGGPEHQI